MSGSYRSSIFSDPGFASAAAIINRALTQDDPYRDLNNLASAASNTELAVSRRQQTQGAADAAAFIDSNPTYMDTPEGRARMGSRLLLAGPDYLRLLGNTNLALGAANYGQNDPRTSTLQIAAGMPHPQTVLGAREHEAESTRRTGITAGATIQAARIAEEGARYRFLHGDARPGAIVGPDRGRALGIPAPQGPSPGLDAGGNPAPGVELPRGPFALPSDANVPGGTTRFDSDGYFTRPDGTLVPPTERRGPPTTPAQVIAQGIEQAGSVQRVINGTATPGERALVTPGVEGANIRAQATLQGVQARQQAIAARGPNSAGAARAQLVVSQLNEALTRTQDPAERQRLVSEADAQLAQIEQTTGANSPAAQAAQIRGRAGLEQTIQRGQDMLRNTQLQGSQRQSLETLMQTGREALQNQRDEAHMERTREQLQGALDQIAGRGGVALTLQNARLDARKQEVEARIEARLNEREADRELQAELAAARNELQMALREAQDDAARERALIAADARVRAAETGAAGRASAQANRPLTRSAEEGMEAAMLRHMRDLLPGAQNNLEARAWVSERAAAYMRQTGLNSDAAARKAAEDLRAAGGEGSNFFARNIIGPWGRGSLPPNLPPASQLPQAAPQGGQQGAPQAPQAPQQAAPQAQQAVPPPAQRVPGQTRFTNAQGQEYVWTAGPNGQVGWAPVR